jgi:hypothetical protein
VIAQETLSLVEGLSLCSDYVDAMHQNVLLSNLLKHRNAQQRLLYRLFEPRESDFVNERVDSLVNFRDIPRRLDLLQKFINALSLGFGRSSVGDDYTAKYSK